MAPFYIITFIAFLATSTVFATRLDNQLASDEIEQKKLLESRGGLESVFAASMRGLVNAAANMAGDKFSDELTGNDMDHPQKSKEQVDAERKLKKLKKSKKEAVKDKSDADKEKEGGSTD